MNASAEIAISREKAHVQEPAEHTPVQQMLPPEQGHPAGQHMAVGGMPQLGSHDAAEAGVGAAMVVMRGKAITIT